MSHPESLGIAIVIESLQDADKFLHELGWLENELAKVEAACKQKIEAIKHQFDLRKVIDAGVEGETITMADRIAQLEAALESWTAENIRPLLPGKKKTRDLLHGQLGLRQKTLVIEIACDDNKEKYDERSVLNWIADSELKPAIKKALTETKVELHLKGAKDAYIARQVTAEELAAVGLCVREAVDEPVVKASRIVVTAD